MGHYWRELFPQEAAEQDRRLAREMGIKKEISKLPLSEFAVEDLPALLRLMDPLHYEDVLPDELNDLERKLNSIKAAQKLMK